MNPKYFVTRSNDKLGADMESMQFSNKTKAVSWGKRCAFCRVRLQVEGRPIVFEKGF